jgi:hypothetical protein
MMKVWNSEFSQTRWAYQLLFVVSGLSALETKENNQVMLGCVDI